MSTKFATEVRRRLRKRGVPEVDHTQAIPTPYTFALVNSHSSGIVLQVRHALQEVRVWFCAPAPNTVACVGVILEMDVTPTSRTFHPQLDPLHGFLPPSVGITLRPLWEELGITSRRAATAEAFGNLDELMAITGRFKTFDIGKPNGAYLLVTHAVVYRTIASLTQILKDRLYAHFSGVACKSTGYAMPADAATLRLPAVKKALAAGLPAMLMMAGPRGQPATTEGKWVPIPV